MSLDMLGLNTWAVTKDMAAVHIPDLLFGLLVCYKGGNDQQAGQQAKHLIGLMLGSGFEEIGDRLRCLIADINEFEAALIPFAGCGSRPH